MHVQARKAICEMNGTRKLSRCNEHVVAILDNPVADHSEQSISRFRPATWANFVATHLRIFSHSLSWIPRVQKLYAKKHLTKRDFPFDCQNSKARKVNVAVWRMSSRVEHWLLSRSTHVFEHLCNHWSAWPLGPRARHWLFSDQIPMHRPKWAPVRVESVSCHWISQLSILQFRPNSVPELQLIESLNVAECGMTIAVHARRLRKWWARFQSTAGNQITASFFRLHFLYAPSLEIKSFKLATSSLAIWMMILTSSKNSFKLLYTHNIQKILGRSKWQNQTPVVFCLNIVIQLSSASGLSNNFVFRWRMPKGLVDIIHSQGVRSVIISSSFIAQNNPSNWMSLGANPSLSSWNGWIRA